MNIDTVIFDMDDTLMPTGHFYWVPKLDCAKMIALDLGADSPDPIALINGAEAVRYELQGREGAIPNTLFQQSWMAYYADLCEQLEREPNPAIISALFVTASMYFRKEYELYPFTKDMLAELKSRKKRILVATVGNEEIQGYKIHNTGLADHVDAIEIMDNKRKQDYQEILAKYNLDPATTVMVGDNDRLDIQPTMDCGMRAFHVVHPFETATIDTTQPLYTAVKSANEILRYV